MPAVSRHRIARRRALRRLSGGRGTAGRAPGLPAALSAWNPAPAPAPPTGGGDGRGPRRRNAHGPGSDGGRGGGASPTPHAAARAARPRARSPPCASLPRRGRRGRWRPSPEPRGPPRRPARPMGTRRCAWRAGPTAPGGGRRGALGRRLVRAGVPRAGSPVDHRGGAHALRSGDESVDVRCLLRPVSTRICDLARGDRVPSDGSRAPVRAAPGTPVAVAGWAPLSPAPGVPSSIPGLGVVAPGAYLVAPHTDLGGTGPRAAPPPAPRPPRRR